jgi:hypothetical protein
MKVHVPTSPNFKNGLYTRVKEQHQLSSGNANCGNGNCGALLDERSKEKAVALSHAIFALLVDLVPGDGSNGHSHKDTAILLKRHALSAVLCRGFHLNSCFSSHCLRSRIWDIASVVDIS